MKRDGVILFFYVDDIVLAFRKGKQEEAKDAVRQLQTRYTLTGGDDLQWFLGIAIIRDRRKRRIWLSQASYIDKIYLRTATAMVKGSGAQACGAALDNSH
jgi:hypothetical protein